MERRSWFGAFIGVLVLAVAGYAGWRTFSYSNTAECYACKRPIHAHPLSISAIFAQDQSGAIDAGRVCTARPDSRAC